MPQLNLSFNEAEFLSQHLKEAVATLSRLSPNDVMAISSFAGNSISDDVSDNELEDAFQTIIAQYQQIIDKIKDSYGI